MDKKYYSIQVTLDLSDIQVLQTGLKKVMDESQHILCTGLRDLDTLDFYKLLGRRAAKLSLQFEEIIDKFTGEEVNS